MAKKTKTILEKVDMQVKKKLSEKYSWRKKVRSAYMRLYKIFGYRLIGKNLQMESNRPDHRDCLGVDEFGRNVANSLEKYVRILFDRGLDVHCVIVLGSRAKGRWTPKSDIDVTVIVDNLPKRPTFRGIERILCLVRWFLLSDIPMFVGVESSGCVSRQDFLANIDNFNISALDALFHGIVIFDDGFWSCAKERYREIERDCGIPYELLKQKLLPV
jgi:predicted nucleotidyltransferase